MENSLLNIQDHFHLFPNELGCLCLNEYKSQLEIMLLCKLTEETESGSITILEAMNDSCLNNSFMTSAGA